VVLDADALTAFSDAPEALFNLLHPDVCLTPHFGEFARLFPDLAQRMNHEDPDLCLDKLSAVKEAAATAGCTILLKGADTVIASHDRKTALHGAVYDRAVPDLATAGAGDVLAGFITGLMARGFSPYDAAKAASWLHVDCARTFGPGLIAEDLPEILPDVLKALKGRHAEV
jgi:NAD(P)H-hydrate repair Nnr-like enzyme with NAD(P)H-hydrate dehydratase domain